MRERRGSGREGKGKGGKWKGGKWKGGEVEGSGGQKREGDGPSTLHTYRINLGVAWERGYHTPTLRSHLGSLRFWEVVVVLPFG